MLFTVSDLTQLYIHRNVDWKDERTLKKTKIHCNVQNCLDDIYVVCIFRYIPI